ncbi:YlbL family protein [Nocardioides coralli]|uniref:YlbL family protein n=1 Tax=Nocardioides coralli TaxID=2872154 RepID=UPI001CA3F0F2|nr:S16 family serine protease [Nocardioides coralli]QZY30109.1 PDZ domain-containing protein [Nocardioides coralli]
MTQRTLAGLLAVPLLVALWLLALREPLPYVTYSPGLTVDVLGTVEDDSSDPILEIEGAETYRDEGELRLTTVLVTPPQSEVNLFQLLGAWIDPDSAIYPYDAIYTPEDTDETKDAEGAFQMASSQDSAIAAALRELDYDFEEAPVIYEVVEDSPADGVFEVGDRILTIDDERVSSPEEVAAAVEPFDEGEPIRFRVARDGERLDLSASREEIDGQPRVGIISRSSFEFPIDVSLDVDPNIGGPSAGLVFSLAIYEALTEGSLTDGENIAGTGTITPEGEVGPIGGIDQKIAGARQDDAELFLVPADNCNDAAESPHGDMRLVRVETIGDAVAALEAWTADRDADLPSCTDTGVASE